MVEKGLKKKMAQEEWDRMKDDFLCKSFDSAKKILDSKMEEVASKKVYKFKTQPNWS